MKRSLLLVLALLLLDAALLGAQRGGGGGGFGGRATVTVGHNLGHNIRPGPSHGFPSDGFRRGRTGIYGRNGYGYGYGDGWWGADWLPWGYPYWDDYGYFWDEPPYQQSANSSQQAPQPQVIVVQSKEPSAPAAPPQSPKLIEVPDTKNSSGAKPQPATLFVLKDGQRLESHYYLLTAQSLEIEIDQQQRTIPISTLDLNSTVAANRERGIDLAIPRDRGTVFLGF